MSMVVTLLTKPLAITALTVILACCPNCSGG